MPTIEKQFLKQPVVALVTLIAWLWLGWSLWLWLGHEFAVASLALQHFLGGAR